MKNKILIIFLLVPLCLFADLYDDAMKYEAKGNKISYKKTLNEYFKKNINNVSQDSIIEKLLYSSTLLLSLNETIDFLKFYVKYMKNSQSRFRIYSKIAEIYELTGKIQNAGIYYEKAAYVSSDYIDYKTLLNSIDMLIELGFFELSITKLIEIENKIDSEFNNRLYSMLCRLYNLKGLDDIAKDYFLKIDTNYFIYNYLKYELFFQNSYISDKTLNSKIIKNNSLKLKNPTDYIGLNSELKNIPYVPAKSKVEYEIFLGTFQNKIDAAGLVNIVEQMKLTWFFDKTDNDNWSLYIFSEDKVGTINKLNSLGLKIEG